MPSAGTFRVCEPGGYPLKEALAEAVALPSVLATMVRSMIEAWPEDVYSRSLVTTRFLGRRTTYVCDPHHIRSLLVDQAASLEREPFMLRALSPALGSGILTADGPHWKEQRRTAAPVFRPDRVRTFVPAMAQAAQATRTRWLNRDASASIRDILPEMMRTTFDIIVATMISGDSQMEVEPFGRAIEAYLAQTSWKIALSMLNAPTWTPHPGARAGAAAANYLRSEVAQTVARRRACGTPGNDLLGLLLQAEDPETGSSLSDDSLVDNLLTFVAAGHETTALALTWTLRVLAEHPQIEHRVLEEIRSLSSDLATDLSAMDQLDYTRQVLLEVMRLYPPAPLIVRRAVVDIRLGDRTLRAGESVHIPVYALHRHQSLWDQPDTFNPDRFSPTSTASRDRYAFLPFGAGPRVCIGMSFALTECLVILATLLPSFRFLPVETKMPTAQFRVTLRPKGGIKMKIVPRHVN